MSIERVLEIRRTITEKTESLRKLLDQAESQGFTSSDKQEYDRGMKEIQKLKAEEERLIRENGLEQELMSHRVSPSGDPTDWPYGTDNAIRTTKDRSYRGMFYRGDRTKILDLGGFESKEEFLKVIDTGRFDPRLEEKRTMTEGTPSAGGYSVPEEMAAEWLDTSLEAEIVRPRCRVYPMISDILKVPAWDDLDHSSGEVYGGFSISWLSETGTATRQTPKLRQIELKTKKAAIYVNASREVAQDSPNFANELETALVKGLGWGLDYYCISGTGAGQPLGILNAASLVTVSKEDGQAADTVVYENLIKMEARLHGACMVSAVWVANATTLPQLKTTVLAVGTGGGIIKALTRQGNQYYLLDRPIFFTEKCPTLGDVGDIILVDLSKYALGLRQGMAIDKSNAPGWLTDTTDWRVITRLDGQPVWDKAFSPKNGDSQSWAVVLEERA